MTGGVALNQDMVRTLSDEMETEIEVAPCSQAVGAVGAAVLAWELSHKKDG